MSAKGRLACDWVTARPLMWKCSCAAARGILSHLKRTLQHRSWRFRSRIERCLWTENANTGLSPSRYFTPWVLPLSRTLSHAPHQLQWRGIEVLVHIGVPVMSIAFTCPECKEQNSVGPEFGGRRGTCAFCGASRDRSADFRRGAIRAAARGRRPAEIRPPVGSCIAGGRSASCWWFAAASWLACCCRPSGRRARPRDGHSV